MSALGPQSSNPQGSGRSQGEEDSRQFTSNAALNNQYLGGDAVGLDFSYDIQNLGASNPQPSQHQNQSFGQEYIIHSHHHHHLHHLHHPLEDQTSTSFQQDTSAPGFGGALQAPNSSVDYMTQRPVANEYESPNFDQGMLSEFGTLLNLQDLNGLEMLSSSSEKTPQSRSSFSGARGNTQQYQQAGSSTGAQLLSPSLTTSSSPASRDDGYRMTSSAQNQSLGTSIPQKLGRVGSDPPQMHTPVSNQQHSPAYTGSSVGDVYSSAPPVSSSLVSPIVRVENYSREESPVRSSGYRSPGQLGPSYLHSDTHLSPYTLESSEDDHTDWSELSQHDHIPVITRQDDGSWCADNASGQAGLSPDDRGALKDVYVPTLNEQGQQRLVAEKNAEVDYWLDHSALGGGSGGLQPGHRSLSRRRAKSTNDMYRPSAESMGMGLGAQDSYVNGLVVPGPGLYIDEKSELDEESDDGLSVPESPPAAVAMDSETYFPSSVGQDDPSNAPAHAKPWDDPPSGPADATATPGSRYQPPTSNAAMMRFRQRARDVESASLAATLGSRRLSESDIGSLFAAAGISQAIPSPIEKAKPKDKRDRSGSFLDHILPKRNNSNVLKRKNSQAMQPNQATDMSAKEVPKIMTGPKRMGSWGRPKSPRADTNLSTTSRESGSSAMTGLTQPGPWAQAKNVIRRSRSRSDLGKKRGLAELMTQHGGPPMLTLASPANDSHNTLPSQPVNAPSNFDDGAEDDLGNPDPIFMDLQIKFEPIIPDYNGFKAHTQRLNPRMPEYMLERVTQEQVRRYKRLQEHKVKHLNNVRKQQCPSNNGAHKFCMSLRGTSKNHPPRQGNKDSAEAPFMGFIVVAPGESEDELKSTSEGTVVAAQFPPGVPLPPVKRLPAEFECTLCFKVKKFHKPSDWTKHVHEDVQPFTCTFVNCTEPKSFKRKADWVRHENERHRQLENWNCNFEGCNHVCYRKDNFVQHLVREHKLPEPRVRPTKSAGDGGGLGESGSSWTPGHHEDIWKLVEECRRDTDKQPQDEPCRFCGNICNSWKKLTVHLAKHMEQISMPILPLIEQRNLNADTVISPVDFTQSSHPQEYSSPSGFGMNASSNTQFPTTNAPTLAMGLDASMQFYSPTLGGPQTSAASQQGNTFPPPQISYGPNELDPSSLANSYAAQSYPGLGRPPKHHVEQHSSHGQLGDNFQYATSNLKPSPVMTSSGYAETQMYASPVDTSSFDDQLAGNFMAQQGQHSASMSSNPMVSTQSSSGGYVAAHDEQYHPFPTYYQEQDRQGAGFRGFG